MISSILAGIFEQRSPRRYIGRHRARESGPLPRPRTAPDPEPAKPPALEMTAAATEVTMELSRVRLPVRSAVPPTD
jgi:hypothetical protein